LIQSWKNLELDLNLVKKYQSLALLKCYFSYPRET